MNLLKSISSTLIILFFHFLSFAQPTNDECIGAKNLISTLDCNVSSSTLADATPSDLTPANSKNDVWFSFIANTASTYISVYTSSGANFIPNIELFSGTCSNLVSNTLTNNSSSTGIINLFTGLIPGQTYYYRVFNGGYLAATNNNFQTCVQDFIPNDECTGAIELTPQTEFNFKSGMVYGATKSNTGVTSGCSTGTSADVWYKFKAVNPIQYIFAEGSTNFNPKIEVFKGTCGSLTNLSCITKSTTTKDSTKLKNLTVDNSTYYYFRIYNSNTTNPTLFFNVLVGTPPTNDDCTKATKVNSNQFLCKTSEDGVSNFATQSLPGVLTGNADDDLWYTFTADTSVHFVTVTPSADYTPMIQVFSNCPSSGGTSIQSFSGTIGTELKAKITGLAKGSPYYYRVFDKLATSVKLLSFSTCVSRPPMNDDCSNSKLMTMNTYCKTIDDDGTNATASTLGAKVTGANADDDLWYTFKPTGEKGFITVNPNFVYAPVIEVFENCTSTTPKFSQKFNAGQTGTINLTGLDPTKNYFYRIYDYAAGNPGAMPFSTCVTSPVSNDDCGGAKNVYPSNTCDEVSGNGLYATESLQACTANTNANDDVWFQFTATGNSHFISVKPNDKSYDPVIQIFTGCPTATPSSPLTPKANACFNSSYPAGKFGDTLVTGLTPNTKYYYRVYDINPNNQDTMTFTTCVTNAVENDDCSGALNVNSSSSCDPVTTNALYASQSFPACAAGTTANDDVWFKFRPTKKTEFISVTPDDKNYEPIVEVYSSCNTKLSPPICAKLKKGAFDRVQLSNLDLTKDYYYRVYDASNSKQDTMSFSTCVVESVDNDSCKFAKPITISDVTPTNGDGTYATKSLAGCNSTSALDDVWYTFTSTATETLNISVNPSPDYDPVVEVFSNCANVMNSIICETGTKLPKGKFGTITLNATTNQTYYYRVYNVSTTKVYPYAFTTSVNRVPINDNCNTATMLTVNNNCAPTDGEVTFATKSPNNNSCWSTQINDVWYAFKATATTQVIGIEASKDFNPIVEVFNSGAGGACPSNTTSSIICEDNRFSPDGYGSLNVSGLTVNNTYYYRVYNGASSTSIVNPQTFKTCVTVVPPPPDNDDPCKAFAPKPTLTTSFTTYTNESATKTTGVPDPGCASFTGGDVWFKTKVPFSGQFTFEMKELSMLDGGMAIYKGGCKSMSLVKCDDNLGANQMPKIDLKSLNPGDSLFIRVWEYGNNNNGTFGLSIVKGPEPILNPPCTNLDFENDNTGWFGTYGSSSTITGSGVITGSSGAPSPSYVPGKLNTTIEPTQFEIMTGGPDNYGGFPRVYKGAKSLRLGTDIGKINNGRSIEQYFQVTKDNNYFIYNYASVLNDGNHNSEEQPFFKVEFFDDNGQPIGCGDYLVASPTAGKSDKIGFLKSPKEAPSNPPSKVSYKPWTTVGVDLTNYIGKNVHVRFTSGSCGQSAHFGYVYLDCSCAKFEIEKPDKVCLGDSARLFGPKGALGYKWKDATGTVISTADSAVFKTTVAGTFNYTCEVTMFGTTMCSSILTTSLEVGGKPTLKITDPAPVCEPNNVDITQSSITTGSTSGLAFSYFSDEFAANTITNQTSINKPGTYYIKGEKSATCFDVQPVHVIINPIAKISDKTIKICSGETFTITPDNTTPASKPDQVPSGTKYKWTVINNTNVTGDDSESTGQSNISQKLTNTTSDIQTVTYTVTPFTTYTNNTTTPASTSICEGATFTITVTVNPQPKIADKTTTICTNNPFEVSPTNTSPDIVPSGTTYTWIFSDNTSVTNEANSNTDESSVKSYTNLLNNTNTVQTVEYTVTPKSGTCIGSNFKVTVKVNPVPKIPDFTKNICTGTSFDATPVDNGTTTIFPIGTTYTWTNPIITGGITGASAQTTGVSKISQTLTNPTPVNGSNGTVTYAITANSNTTPNCSSTFNAEITVEPKIEPVISCGVSDATTMEFTWLNLPSATSYNFEYKIGSNGTTSPSSTILAGTTSKTVTGLSAASKVYFTLTPVGMLCPQSVTKMCPNCIQPTIVNNNATTPSDFDICVGEKITLKASETPTNATPWIIQDNTIISNTIQTTKNLIDITGLKEGKSNVEFTNGECSNSIDINVNPKPVISNITKTICSGDKIEIIPDNTTNTIPSGTTYTWTVAPVNGISGTNIETTAQPKFVQTLTNSTNAPIDVVYTVTASIGTSPNNCTNTFTITVTVNPKPLIADMNSTICSGSAFTLSPTNGNGNIVPSGTKYTWTQNLASGITGNNDQSVAQNNISETLTNTTSADVTIIYTITATSETCTNTFKGNVIVKAKPYVENKTDLICSGSSFSLTPTTSGNDIIPTGTTFKWTVPNVVGLTGFSDETSPKQTITQSITNTTSSVLTLIYNVTASVGTAPICTSTFTETITVNPKPSINQLSKNICSEETFDITPTDGNGNIVPVNSTFTWTSAPVTDITGNIDQTTEIATISQTLTNKSSVKKDVTYKVNVKSNNNSKVCETDFDAIISVYPKPLISQNPIDICTDNKFTISPVDGNNNNIVPIGTTYTWKVVQGSNVSGGNNESNAQNTISEILTNSSINTEDATYTITAKTNLTQVCSSDFTAIIHVNPKPKISTQNLTICSGSTFNCLPTSSTTDVVPSGTKYSWTANNISGITGNSDETNEQTSISQKLTNTKDSPITITYKVKATVGVSPNICSYDFDLNVTVNPTPKIAQKTATICSGQTFEINPINNLPTEVVPANTTYTWTVTNTNGTTGSSSSSIANNNISQTILNTTPNPIVVDYTISASTGNTPTICTSTFIGKVTINPLPDFSPTATSQCEKDPLYVQANFTNAKKVVWSGPNGFANTSTTDSKITAVAIASISDNGIYTVEVTDVNDCKNTKTVAVTINPLPNVSAGPDKAICLGDLTKLNGTGAISYEWDNNVTDNTNFSPTSTKTYTVIGKDVKGCVNSDKVDIIVNILPDFTLSVNDPCEQQTLAFSVDLSSNPSTAGIKTSIWTGPNSFNATALTPSITPVSSFASGEYKLTLTDNNNCQRSKTINAFVNPIDNILFSDINPKCVNNDPFFLPVPNIIGGTWSSDDKTSVQDPYTGLFDPSKSKPDELYKVIVTYSTETILPKRKCPNIKSKVVFVNPIPDSNFYALNPVLCIDDTLHLVVNKLEKNVTHLWDLGNGVQLNSYGKLDYVYPKDGDFTIKLVSALGDCKVSRTIDNYIHVIQKPTEVDFSQSATEIDFYNPDIQFNSYTNGKYLLWNFGDGTFSNYKNPSHKFPEKPGEYIIELTASNMENNYCSKTVVRSIFMPEPVVYFIPNTFTPNGDEINNVFQPIFTYGYDPQNYSFFIYNRWGELIFESHDAKYGWDGTFGDNLVANDTYIWKLEFKEKIQETKHVKTGHVNVLR